MLLAYPFLMVGVSALPFNRQSLRGPINSEAARSMPALKGAAANVSQAVPSRACGTGPPTSALLDTHLSLRRKRLEKRASPSTSKFTVETYFHIVSAKDSSAMVTKDMVANQLGALQAAYASSNISFNLVSTDYTVNDAWAANQNDTDMKLALRKGNYSALNIYFQTNLSVVTGGSSTQLLGYCTLPTNVTYSPCSGCPLAEQPASDYYTDGCNVLAGSMPNGYVSGYNQGKTAVHEVGHWFGLLHTFQDTSCSPDDPGDYIDDTPQESVSTDGCPAGKKSCPDCPGIDPIHNFMDYSTDACFETFTPEQITRMQDMYQALRFGN